MTLVDTSVWIDHFRADNPALRKLVDAGDLTTHPFVIGEIACGSIRNRADVIGYLAELPQAASATHLEVLAMLEQRRLWNKGIGWIDAHLLASALLSNSRLWTHDRALKTVAQTLNIAYA